MSKTMQPIVIEEELEQDTLDQLRAQLGLEERGRLDDSEDVEYGTRYLRKDEASIVAISLYRDCADGWPGGYCSSPVFRFELWYHGEPPSNDLVASWRSQILRAVEDAGLHVATTNNPE